jgi:thioester reductase-like protein
MESIFSTLDYWATKNSQKLLFSFLDLDGKETETYSYQAFLDRTHAIARHLRADHGFHSDDRVLLAFPPGLEMICAFFGCARAGLIPVPVYPPTSHGFASALHKMVHIAKDCEAAGLLLGREYDRSLKSNISRNDDSAANAAYLASIKWIVTEDLTERATSATYPNGEILFLQYTSGSTTNPKGVMVTHANVLHNRTLVADHSSPVAVSWLPQYHDMGLIGYYLYSALSGGTTYGFSPTDFIQRPALWLEAIHKYRASATSAPNFAFDYCLRSGRLSKECLESTDLSSLKFLMAAGEPVRPATYSSFLQRFQPLGLKPETFFVAYGLAENTLAVSSYGRNVLSVNKSALSLSRVRAVTTVSEIASSKQIISCGKPLGDVVVKIVDPEKHVALEDGKVGEIWVAGKSKCLGYWNNLELTRKAFHAHIINESQNDENYLRTGDLGFFYAGEIYVCGRTKDVIVIRGQNYYPQDIEHIVEDSSELIRKSCVVAFEMNDDGGALLAVVAEVKSVKTIPDPHVIVAAIRKYLNIEAAVVAFIAPRGVPKTSSGKIMRHLAKQMWINGEFQVLTSFSRSTNLDSSDIASPTGNSPFDVLKARYNLSGHESYSLIEAGVDSLDLVLFMHELQELLKQYGSGVFASEIDLWMVQQITVADLFLLADLFIRSPEAAVLRIRSSLVDTIREHRAREERMMIEDRKVAFRPPDVCHSHRKVSDGIFLTGSTGFVGPFLLRSLLEQTGENLYVLIRAADEHSARRRLQSALESIGPVSSALQQIFNDRVIPVCGDLELADLGLQREQWATLANRTATVFHNGAAVNYLFNYGRMRSTNVAGTQEIVRFAFHGQPKTLNYISTTFIFGWAIKEVLYETDCNSGMELLDFGYSQSKWVAEQIVMNAARLGLSTRIYRPALISPSVSGGGNNLDIAIRLLAFMVNHGIGVEAFNQVSFVPADVAANNIVAISKTPGTISQTFHVTRDQYASMMDITEIVTRLTGRQFEMFKIANFVPEVIKRCTKDDPLFPLLDFLIGSVDSIASMEFKRYDSSGYQAARDACLGGMPDPSLEDTTRGILRFMNRRGLISVRDTSVELPSRAVSRNDK